MLVSSDVNDSVSKLRPPVPPRPNKSVLDVAVLKYKSKSSVETPEGVVSVTKNNGPGFNNISNFNRPAQTVHLVRTDLGQHVHESEPMFQQNGQRHSAALLINKGKSVCPGGLKSDFYEKFSKSNFHSGATSSLSPTKIKQSNWYQVEEESGRPVKYSSCHIILDDSCASSPINERPRAVSMSSLQGLPPLPKSLSGINLLDSVKVTTQAPVTSESLLTTKSHQQRIPITSPPPPPPSEPKKQTMPLPRKVTSLETQLAMLRKEMYSLRELDLSLLSQLWSLNESIQEFRQMQEAFSPPSPSSDVEDDAIYTNLSVLAEHQPYPLSSSSSRSSNMDMGDV